MNRSTGWLPTRSALLALLLTLLVAAVAHAQATDPIARSRELFREAMQHKEAEQYDEYRRVMEEANQLRPNHPTMIYLLASASSLAGDTEDALDLLDRLARMGILVDPTTNDDFLPLQELPGYEAVQSRLAENSAVIGTVEVTHQFEEDDFIPESVAHDPQTGDFFVGSVHKRKIVRLTTGEEPRVFSAPDDGLWSVMGLKVDAKRRLLWVCTTAALQGKDTPQEDEGKTAVVRFDLDTGAVQKRYVLEEPDVIHWFGDLELTPNGDVYITDSMSPRVYRIAADSDQLEVFCENARFASLQGIALAEDGRHLYVADYSNGIFRLDTQTSEVSLLGCPEDATLLGIDGLYTHGKDVLAIQNGVSPHRVIRVSVDEERGQVRSVTVLAANHPEFDEPTLGLVLGNEFYFVGNSQWYRFDQEGALDPEGGSAGPQVLKLKL